MAFAMKEDKAADPVEIELLGAQRIMFHSEMPADAIEEFWC